MRVHKLDVARNQLDVAADLFSKRGDCFSIHTLAGAAEEILGKLLDRNNGENMFERMRRASLDKFGRVLSTKELSKLVNKSRNAIKHADDPDEDVVCYDPNDAAVMLYRALINYQLLARSLTATMEISLTSLRERHPQLFNLET